MKRKNNQNNLSLYTILYCSRGDERRFFFCLTPNLILAMHSEIPGAAQHLMLLLMARSVLGFIDAQLVMRGRSMVDGDGERQVSLTLKLRGPNRPRVVPGAAPAIPILLLRL
jgi:hypothetical protein